MPQYHETAHPEGPPGEYGVHPTFAHGGDYRLVMTVQPPQDAPFQVEFPLRVLDSDRVVKRKPIPARYSVEVTTNPKRPKAGEPVEIRFVFHDRINPKVVLSSFETVHESLFHLIMVRTDLSHFAHIHPVLGADGGFRVQHTFLKGGEYHLFADVAPVGAGSQGLMAKVAVSGDYAERFDAKARRSSRTQQVGQTTIEILSAQESFPVKKSIDIRVAINDSKTGQPIPDLEPYLGAAGHFLLIHEDAMTFVHSHPSSDSGPSGSLQFSARFPKPGLYRGWIQVKRNGELLTADFVVRAHE
jgi:hypothetical protein